MYTATSSMGTTRKQKFDQIEGDQKIKLGGSKVQIFKIRGSKSSGF
jgi:hypothetical protein